MANELDRLLQAVEGFDWDAGNTLKNVLGHGVSQAEAESMFFNVPLMLEVDAAHSTTERRYHALGSTAADRLLQAAFTIRGRKLRIISVRDMSRKERIHYEAAR